MPKFDAHGQRNLSLIGDTGSNVLTGNSGNNIIDAGNGTDLIIGDGGIDTMIGGGGNDTFDVDVAGDVVTELAGGGTDTVRSGTLSLSLSKYANVERLLLTGSANLNLTGNSLANALTGNSGANVLIGGTGRDTMAGGSDGVRDVFDFNAVKESGKTATTRDVIKDFQHLIDDIDLSTIDSNGLAAGNAAFKFLAMKGAAFTGVKGQLHWLQQNFAGTANDKTIVEGDIDGDKHADFQIEITGLKTLTAGDFIL